MSYRVYVEDDFMAMRFRIYLIDTVGDQSGLIDGQGQYHPQDPNATVDREHALAVVPHDAAHAVLGALARRLGAVEHPEQLRRDYEHERGRVDKLINWLMAGGA